MKCVIGYKAYNKGLVNRYNEKYEIGKEYVSVTEIKWQTEGFHFVTNMEDVLRYYDGFEEIDICLVVGYGNLKDFYDSYYDYEIMVADHIRLIKKLSREEIITYAKHLNDYRLCRFVSGYKLTDEEIDYLAKGRSETVLNFIRYYQYGDKDVFSR